MINIILFAILGALLVVGLLWITSGVYIIRQAEHVIIERFGKFQRVLHPGIRWIARGIDKPRSVAWTYFVHEGQGKERMLRRYTMYTYRIDMRESVYDFPKQYVITKDNVLMEINAVLYYQIIDPYTAVYAFNDLTEGIEKLTQTTLRNIIGHMDLDETLVSRDRINERMQVILDDATHKWGMKINRVELQEINPPADIRHAMEKQMRAERDRRAMILEAEGHKTAAILRAEGEKESAILSAQGKAESQIIAAEGEAEARLRIAKAEADALECIKQAIGDQQAQYAIAIKYLEMLPKLAENADRTIVLPYEASAALGSLAGIKELFLNNVKQ